MKSKSAIDSFQSHGDVEERRSCYVVVCVSERNGLNLFHLSKQAKKVDFNAIIVYVYRVSDENVGEKWMRLRTSLIVC